MQLDRKRVLDGALFFALALIGMTFRTHAAVSLDEALDTTNLVWTSAGTASWQGQSTISHDGVDAAQSGTVVDGAAVALQTTVTGPGTISFWWKVSSEADGDSLGFHVGSTEQWDISGEIDWQYQSFSVPAGSQILKWTYSKNASVSAGQDRGWVDQVQFQPGSTCTYSVSPTSRTHGYGAATNLISVSTAADCAWTAVCTNAWLTIISGTTGSGSGVVSYAIAFNSTPVDRIATLSIAGRTVTITQRGTSCIYSLSPTNRQHGAGMESGTISMQTPAGCAWTVFSLSPWVTLQAPTNGYGNGTVSYTLAANPGAARTAVISVAGQPFTVNQSGLNCSYTISPVEREHGGGIETGSVAVATGGGCPWSVANSNDWIAILQSPNNSSGTVVYSVASNLTGVSRSGFLTIAGLAFAVTQSPAAGLPNPVSVGPVEVSTLGHAFIRPLPPPSLPATVLDYFIDQDQSSGGGALLPEVSVNWDTNVQFSLTVSAPPGRKFMVHVPPGRAAAFNGFLIWESTRGGFSGPGTARVEFGDLEGTPPEFSRATPVLSDSHGFWGFVDLEGGTFSNDIAFTSIRLTATVPAQFTGNGTEFYVPHHDCALQVHYGTPATSDPGPFVSLVPTDAPLALPPSVAVMVLSNGDIEITFNGVLQQADTVDGPFADVPENPRAIHTISKDSLGTQRYFRARTSSP